MLASPLYAAPAPFTPEGAKYSKDIDSFNKLLPPPVEFIEGSSTLAVPEGKYEPINVTPKPAKPEVGSYYYKSRRAQSEMLEQQRVRHTSPPTSPAKASAAAAPSGLSAKAAPLHTGVIDTTWPANCNAASGLYNSGNTCFLNSALQCLFHTPPLLRMLYEHSPSKCRVQSGAFCMACNLRAVSHRAHTASKAFIPIDISSKLQVIAKHMRKGRQEDSHEFLRYAIDALQKSCLAGHPAKIDSFGSGDNLGAQDLRDTFDSILDLSLDIHNMTGVRAALRKFVQPDTLKGADKYKCEKCKKPVVAEKRFSIHDAPIVLTVHLKRFTPMGRKIGTHIDYEERLTLEPYMSEGQHGPKYSLYGVICHAGGGPNSGHYFAYVKSRSGSWYEMNDESVSSHRSAPVNLKNAYILFYLRDKGQGLDAAVNAKASAQASGGGSIAAGMKKRRVREEDEDTGDRVSKPFIGPRMPSPPPQRQAPTPPKSDPQADLVRKKIEAVRSGAGSKALAGLGEYASDSDKEDDRKPSPSTQYASTSLPPSSPLPPTSSSAAVSPISATASSFSSPATSVPAANFYGTTPTAKKRKHPELHQGRDQRLKRSPLGPAQNPYGNNRLTKGPPKQYGKFANRRPRGL
ncbi:Ubiquitin carboxyl-terminal hydrolase [Mycena sanguinolenta]|uniref:Ubiquitin carboxyl-terminal hydrolase n=1 Tax=Mycena sanguinolenta TaxID=230812 RepID=A0A8H6YAD7_9AGAR|nr:Ubiquitin carboxyl-terminal hydrolase [Mycena sanguinolenta]